MPVMYHDNHYWTRRDLYLRLLPSPSVGSPGRPIHSF